MKRNNLIIFAGGLLVIFAVIIFIIAKNENAPANNTNKKINIMVSILPQANFVENIGRDKVSVSAMIPPGFSPATYDPDIEQ